MGRFDKLAVAVALSVGSLSAFGADACAALDYQEMKDMSVEQLSTEWCHNAVAEKEAGNSIFEIAMGRARGNQDELSAQADKCRGEKRRIERVIAQKDSALNGQALVATCRKAGKI